LEGQPPGMGHSCPVWISWSAVFSPFPFFLPSAARFPKEGSFLLAYSFMNLFGEDRSSTFLLIEAVCPWPQLPKIPSFPGILLPPDLEASSDEFPLCALMRRVFLFLREVPSSDFSQRPLRLDQENWLMRSLHPSPCERHP